jgi:hypothetical protein
MPDYSEMSGLTPARETSQTLSYSETPFLEDV